LGPSKNVQNLPANVEAEKAVLGSIFLNNELFFEDSTDIKSTDFALDSHQKIWTVINDILFGMVDGIKTAEINTVSNELSNRKWLTSVGGVAYLASLTENLPYHFQVGEYIGIIKDKARLRRLMGMFKYGLAKAEDQSESASSILEEMEDRLIEESGEGSEHAVKIGSVSPLIEQRVENKRVENSERVALELTWGVDGLDRLTKGAFGGELTVLGGDSGGGKTAAAVQMTLENAREGTPCAWFSLEMPKDRVGQRYYPAMGNTITADMMRDPRLMNEHTHIPEVRRLSGELGRLPIWIDDTSSLHINRLVARIRMMRRKLAIRLFIVDYLQLIQHSAKTEVEGIREIVYKLRDLVKSEPTIHIVLLSQFSKSDGFSKKKARTKGDLYGGSTIHHAAHNVFLITIEDPEKRDKNDLLDVVIRVAKQREGRTGKVECNFDRDHLKFCYPTPILR
jgi:replicative DNA helicase